MNKETEGHRSEPGSASGALLGLIIAGEPLDAAALALAEGMSEHELTHVLEIARLLKDPQRPPGGAPVLRDPHVWVARHGPSYHVYAIARRTDGTYTLLHLAPAPSALHAAVMAVNLQRRVQGHR